MDCDSPSVSRTLAQQNEPPACIARYGDDRPDSDLLIGELVLFPIQAFIRREQHMVRRLFIVCHDEYRPRVTEFPEMGVFVNFFPGETGVTAQECVTVSVANELLPDVTHSHDQTDHRWTTESGARIDAFGVAMDMKGAVLKGDPLVEG